MLKFIAAFFSGLLVKILPFLTAYRLGKVAEQKKELERDTEAAKRIAEARGGAPDSRDDLVDRLRRNGL